MNERLTLENFLRQFIYTEEEIAKIWGGNFLRVLTTAQKAASNKR